jgi:branched-chain amino acid transport system substrate-binding protein
LLRWRFPRSASLLTALALLLALTACQSGRMVPAPLGSPQSPYFGAGPPPPPLLPGPVAPPPSVPGPVKVALLVPLSGASAEYGKAMRDAAQLALFATRSDRVTLILRDTGGTAEGAANAARSAVGEGAQLILGPLLAAEVEAVRSVVRDSGVAVIAFSTATQLAGGNIFLMGFLPRQEVIREVSFARERGLGRFAALAPNSAYGHLMAEALRETVGQSGATLARIEYFDPRGGDIAAAVRRLLPPRAGAEPTAAAATAPASAAPDFDALLLPEGGEQLKQIVRQLQEAGIAVPQVRLLGSGLWDDRTSAGDPALYGGWFAAAPPDLRHQFESRFQATYNYAPLRLASLAFDAAGLAAKLASDGGATPFSHDAILNPSGFIGVDGLFRFTQDGLVQRGLAVLEVQPQGNVVVSPAPPNFRDFVY